MATQINRLSARTVATLKKAGRHSDGQGLYLYISDNGGRRFVFRYRSGDKIREKGLGSARSVTLAEAREAAAAARKKLRDNIDPIDSEKSDIARTFADCAQSYIATNESGWKNAKHREQWANTLKTYADPVIGKVAIDKISVDQILKILKPIWSTKTETASRVRGRIEAVLDWAAAHGYRSNDNPARWRGHLDKVLPAIRKVAKVVHHPALPYTEIGPFMKELLMREGIAARALEFAILTAARTGEVVGARHEEVNRETKVWTIPAERMKAGVEHRVPLSDRAMTLLMSLPRVSDYVFPGSELKGPLSNMALSAVLKRMCRDDITVHGFRSTFRDWAAETTEFQNALVEMALAHRIKDKAELAYRRGDMLERRRTLMVEWQKYIEET